MKPEALPRAALNKWVGFETAKAAHLAAARNAAAEANEIRRACAYAKIAPDPLQQVRLDHLDAQRSQAQTAHDELHDLCSNLQQGLGSLPRDARLEPTPPPLIQLVGDETIADALTKTREQIAALGRKLDMVRMAPLPIEAKRDLAREYALSLAARCRPAISFHNDQIRCDFLRPESDPQTAFLDGLSALAWINPDAFADALIREIDAMPEPGSSIDATSRIKEVARLEREIIMLERREEALVEIGLREGLALSRRSECSALAVFGVRVVTGRNAASVAA
jgi:hypothetical protein